MKNPKAFSLRNLAAATAVFLVIGFSLTSCSDSSSPTEPVTDATAGAGSGSGTSNTGDSGSGDSGDGDGADGSTTSGTLAIKMIDDSTDEICQLFVYIQDIRVKPAGQPPVLLGTEIGGWDLLSLVQGVEAPLGIWVVDGGVYQFIEMMLDESQSYVIEVNPDYAEDPSQPPCLEAQEALQIPSEKFKVNGGPFSVDSETTVTIDFDAEKSLKRKGSPNNPKGWQLNPRVSIVEVQ